MHLPRRAATSESARRAVVIFPFKLPRPATFCIGDRDLISLRNINKSAVARSFRRSWKRAHRVAYRGVGGRGRRRQFTSVLGPELRAPISVFVATSDVTFITTDTLAKTVLRADSDIKRVKKWVSFFFCSSPLLSIDFGTSLIYRLVDSNVSSSI